MQRWSPRQILEHLAQSEAAERAHRSLERRLRLSEIKKFKPMPDSNFDCLSVWKLDRSGSTGCADTEKERQSAADTTSHDTPPAPALRHPPRDGGPAARDHASRDARLPGIAPGRHLQRRVLRPLRPGGHPVDRAAQAGRRGRGISRPSAGRHRVPGEPAGIVCAVARGAGGLLRGRATPHALSLRDAAARVEHDNRGRRVHGLGASSR